MIYNVLSQRFRCRTLRGRGRDCSGGCERRRTRRVYTRRRRGSRRGPRYSLPSDSVLLVIIRVLLRLLVPKDYCLFRTMFLASLV